MFFIFADVAVATLKTNEPLITSRALKFMPANQKPKQAWLQTLATITDDKLGIIDLHPRIFGAFPR